MLLATTVARAEIITKYNNDPKAGTSDYAVFVKIPDLLIAITMTHG